MIACSIAIVPQALLRPSTWVVKAQLELKDGHKFYLAQKVSGPWHWMLLYLQSLFHLQDSRHPFQQDFRNPFQQDLQTFSPCSSFVGKSRMRARTGWGTKPSNSGSSPQTSTTSQLGETPPRWQKELRTWKREASTMCNSIWGAQNLWIGLESRPSLLIFSHFCKRRSPSWKVPLFMFNNSFVRE